MQQSILSFWAIMHTDTFMTKTLWHLTCHYLNMNKDKKSCINNCSKRMFYGLSQKENTTVPSIITTLTAFRWCSLLHKCCLSHPMPTSAQLGAWHRSVFWFTALSNLQGEGTNNIFCFWITNWTVSYSWWQDCWLFYI